MGVFALALYRRDIWNCHQKLAVIFQGGIYKVNIIRKKMEEKGKPLAKPSGCITGGDCANCASAAGCTSPDKKEN